MVEIISLIERDRPPNMETTRHSLISHTGTSIHHLAIEKYKFSLQFIAALNKSTALDAKGRAINGRKAVDPEYVYTLQFTASDHECGEI